MRLAARVLGSYEAGDRDEALEIYLNEELPKMHDVELLMRELVTDSMRQMTDARDGFQSDRKLLAVVGWTLSGVSLASALLIGLVLSLAFIRPVRRIDSALARIAVGDFTERIDVPNRDEFGTLCTNLNKASEQLSDRTPVVCAWLSCTHRRYKYSIRQGLSGLAHMDQETTARVRMRDRSVSRRFADL